MSKQTGPEIAFRCANDCRQEGCPGHVIREVFNRSTDNYSFLIDGKQEYVFDENTFFAMLRAHEANRQS